VVSGRVGTRTEHFSCLHIERDGCARYERYEGTLYGDG
jgi:hypothetical protein